MTLRILYRGPLKSCSYGCAYCPLPLEPASASVREADRRGLRRLLDWVREQRDARLGILFTPWGEALERTWYRDAVLELSHLPQVDRVAAQTNLSRAPDWLTEARVDTVALWATFHPGSVSQQRFLGRCRRLDTLGLRYSVGAVGLRQHIAALRALRQALPIERYLWINAYKDAGTDYYGAEEIQALTQIDPLFGYSLRSHASRGRACRAGRSVFSVDGDGLVRRCHFVCPALGQLEDGGLERLRTERPCPNERCDCFIGFAHLEGLGLDTIFGEGLLERVPRRPIWSQAERPSFLPDPVARRPGLAL